MHIKVNKKELLREDWSGEFFLGLAEANLDDLQGQQDNFLSKSEIEELEKHSHDRRRHSYLLGRWCAKQLISKYFNINPKNISIKNGIFGNPLIDGDLQNFGISISHTNNIAVVLIYPHTHPMAIDIELKDDSRLSTINKYITTNEKKYNLPLQIWAARESVSKILACGISVPKDILEINKLTKQDNTNIFTYKNLFHVKSYVITTDKLVVSITLPYKTVIKDVLSLFQ